MNEAVFTEMTGVLDEAIEVAQDAVKAAELNATVQTETPAEPEKVKLVKVANSRFQEVADNLLKTGSFKGHTMESLSNSLRNAGPAEFLELMEKLASSAVFPFDSDMELGGDLVERSTTENREDRDPSGANTKTDVWFEACRDAGLNV